MHFTLLLTHTHTLSLSHTHTLTACNLARSRSASRPSSFIDSDSYVVVGKDQIMEGQSGELDSVGKSGSTAASTSSNRGEQQRDIAGQSSAGGVCVYMHVCVCASVSEGILLVCLQ